MNSLLTQLTDIKVLAVLIGAGFALYQYNRQLKFRRLQNLSLLLNKFIANEQMMVLFHELNQEPAQLDVIKEIPYTTKLRYMALLEEVALHAEHFEVDKKHVKYMFQWLFYYAYLCPNVASAFWDNMGGYEEMNQDYWEKSRSLASKIRPSNT